MFNLTNLFVKIIQSFIWRNFNRICRDMSVKINEQPLQEHLSLVLQKLLEQRPDNPVEVFDAISRYVSDGTTVPKKRVNEILPSRPLHFYRGIKIKENVDWARQYIDVLKVCF